MTLRLRPNVFMVRSQGRMIFLDLEGDRYCAVRAECGPMVPDARRDSLAERLIRAQLCARPGEPGRAFEETQFPHASEELASSQTPLDLTTAVRVWTARRLARHSLRRDGLASVVRRRRALRSVRPMATLGADRVKRAAQSFRAYTPLSIKEGECLYNALSLLTYLGRAAVGVDWVFAVRALPFEAHCWVQAGSCLLDETLEGVAGYMPIMAA